MTINPVNLLRNELIGLKIEIIDSKNKSLIGLKGKIIDETKNIILIKQDNKIKRIIKNQVTMKIYLDNKKVEIDGKLLVSRPEDRIKK